MTNYRYRYKSINIDLNRKHYKKRVSQKSEYCQLLGNGFHKECKLLAFYSFVNQNSIYLFDCQLQSYYYLQQLPYNTILFTHTGEPIFCLMHVIQSYEKERQKSKMLSKLQAKEMTLSKKSFNLHCNLIKEIKKRKFCNKKQMFSFSLSFMTIWAKVYYHIFKMQI